MAVTVQDGRNNFLDIQKMLGLDGKPLPIAETLNQVNVALQDAPVTPSNQPLGHTVTFRRGLPAISTGKINQGIAKSKTTTGQSQDSIGLFTARNETDLKIRHVSGDDAFLMERAKTEIGYAESFAQYLSGQLLYGSILTDESSFDGFITRMPNLQRPLPGPNGNGSQIVSNGTVAGGDGTSIIIVDWHPYRGCHLIYPANSKSGGLTAIQYDMELGIPVTDANGNTFQAAVTEWLWAVGLAIEDSRRMARLANVDIADARLGAQAQQAQIVDSLIETCSLMPQEEGFQRVAYMHPLLLSAFTKQTIHTATTLLIHMDEYLGHMTPHYGNMPFRRMDQFLTSEGTVS